MVLRAAGVSILGLAVAFIFMGTATAAETPTEQIRSRDMPPSVPPSSATGRALKPPADLDTRRSGLAQPATPSDEREFRERREREAEQARDRREDKRESRGQSNN